jgi:osmoprotectant transport system ATP-binding protein
LPRAAPPKAAADAAGVARLPEGGQVLELDNVSMSYDGGRCAVRGVALQVAPGEQVTLVGPAFAGKTTALMMLNRLIAPTAGRVLVNGRDVHDATAADLRGVVGHLSQSINLYPHLPVAAHVGMIPRQLGWSPRRVQSRVAAVLGLVGLAPAAVGPRLPRELSPADRQRVKFARGLAADPRAFLLDEPFAGLDFYARDLLRRDFSRVLRGLRIAAVLATRDLTDALLFADRVVVMQAGRVRQVGTPMELMAEADRRPGPGAREPSPGPADLRQEPAVAPQPLW